MSFNSSRFLAFFVLVALVHFLLPARHRWKLLLGASYIFYMSLLPAYVVFLAGMTLVDYVCALRIGSREDRRARRPWLIVSCVGNLGSLIAFKYAAFLAESLNPALGWLGLPPGLPVLHPLLPLGISFSTLQSLGYIIDVYRGDRPAERHLGFFALYVAFFPQLVAGPISRSRSLIPQFHLQADPARATNDFSHERVVSGLWLILGGFFKKLVIADRLGFYVQVVYGHPESYGPLPTVLATYFFAFQIFCDFSGYTDIALGTARILGYELMENFRRPYFSTSIREFWHRWHISLSSWFRDYLYIPLGGNRSRGLRWAVNIVIVFALSGLWHGARWTFVCWGLLHGIFYLASPLAARVWEGLGRRAGLAPGGRVDHLLRVVFNFNLVCFAWIFFRAPGLQEVGSLLASFGRAGAQGVVQGLVPTHALSGWDLALDLLLVAGLLASQALANGQKVVAWVRRAPLVARWAVAYALLLDILAFGRLGGNEFIYFQF